MDKKTLSHYGWVVVLTLVLSVMIAFSTPLGEYVGDAIVSISQGYTATNQAAIDEDRAEQLKDKFGDMLECPHENTHLTGVIEATCGEQGYTGDLTCKDCFATLEAGQVIDGTIHDYGDAVIKVQATCSDEGVSERTCKKCRHIEKTKIEKLAHSNFYQSGEKPATCINDGTSANKMCGVCHSVVEAGSIIPATGHTVVKIEGVQSTCLSTGLTEGSRCSTCNAIIKAQVETPKSSHTSVFVGTENIHTRCSVCGITTEKDHTYTITTLGTSNCITGATLRSECECGYFYDSTFAPTTHTPVKVPAVAATCTSKGSTEYTKCSVCNTVIKEADETPINASNHSGTIVAGGEELVHSKYNCCNKVVSTSHSFQDTVARVSTCKQTGETDRYCDCGYYYTKIEPALGHDVQSAVNGVAELECGRCDALIIPTGGTYYVEPESMALNSYIGATKTIVGDGITTEFPETVNYGDAYTYGDYEYRYELQYDVLTNKWDFSGNYRVVDGWSARVKNATKTSYDSTYETINGKKLYALTNTYSGCTKLTSFPTIPSSVESLDYTFKDCTKLTYIPDLDGRNNISVMDGAFSGCTALTTMPYLPTNVEYIEEIFKNCISLQSLRRLPATVKYIDSAFSGCTSITNNTNMPIPKSVVTMTSAFSGCTSLSGDFKIEANPTRYNNAFKETVNKIVLVGSSNKLVALAATDGYSDYLDRDNVRVVASNPIPVGGTYRVGTTDDNGDYKTETTADGLELIYIGDGRTIPFPVTDTYDMYTYGDYNYCYGTYYIDDYKDMMTDYYMTLMSQTGWSMHARDIQKVSYEKAEEYINGIPVIYGRGAFRGCNQMVTSPELPSTIESLQDAFVGCTSLQTVQEIPNGIRLLDGTFKYCTSLKTIPNFPSNIKTLWQTFYGCTSLEGVPQIPDNITNFYQTFYNCVSLSGYMEINTSSVENYGEAFAYTYEKIYLYGDASSVMDGDKSVLQHLADSDYESDFTSDDNVRVLVDNPIPVGGYYYTCKENPTVSNYIATVEIDRVYEGDGLTVPWPEPKTYDSYEYGQYIYTFNAMIFSLDDFRVNNYRRLNETGYTFPENTWSVHVSTTELTTYQPFDTYINRRLVTYPRACYANCSNMVNAPSLPDTIVTMQDMYWNCASLVYAPKIPENVICVSGTFAGCASLTEAPVLPENITSLYRTFMHCNSLTTAPKIPSKPHYFIETFYSCDVLSGVIEINNQNVLGPDTTKPYENRGGDCFKYTLQKIYLTGSSPYLTDLAASDGYTDFSDSDNVRVYTNTPIPLNAVYYVQPTTNKMGQYSGAKARYVGDNETVPYPTPQTGDVLVYGEYEYRYNQYMDFWSPVNTETDKEYNYWMTDNSQNGWGVRVLDKSKTSYGPMLDSLGSKNVVALTSTFEDCQNLTCLQEGFEIPSQAVRFDQMFDQCINMTSVPDTFKLPATAKNLKWMFYQCEKLSFADYRNGTEAQAFLIPSSVIDMYQMFMECTNLQGPIRIDATPDSYWQCFNEVETEVNLIGMSGNLAEIADQDDNNVVHCKYVPNGGTYYDIDTTDAHYIKNFQYLGDYQFPGNQLIQKVVGDGLTTQWPTMTEGDIFTYHDYEYRFNLEPEVVLKSQADQKEIYVGPGYILTKDQWVQPYLENMDGWGARAFNYTRDADEVMSPVLKSIYKKNIVSLRSTYENFASTTKLHDYTIVSKYVKSTVEMFDECYMLKELPEHFNLNSPSLIDVSGTFWACTSLKSLPEGFYVGENVEKITWLFDGSAIEGVVDIRTNKLSAPGAYSYALGSYKQGNGSYNAPSKITGVIGTDYADEIWATKDSWSYRLVNPTQEFLNSIK